MNGNGLAFYASIVCAGFLLLPRLQKTDVDRPEDCRELFLGTPRIGKVILAGLVIDAVTHRLMTGVPL